MPITVHAYRSIADSAFAEQIERIYDTSPEFGDGHDALEQLQQQLEQYTTLYTAEFNSKIIGAIWCTGQGSSRLLENVVVHPANRGRGVAERLVEEVCKMEEAQGVQTFEPGCGAIHRCLSHIGKI